MRLSKVVEIDSELAKFLARVISAHLLEACLKLRKVVFTKKLFADDATYEKKRKKCLPSLKLRGPVRKTAKSP